MQKYIIILLLIATISLGQVQAAEFGLDIVPLPKKIQTIGGSFPINKHTVIITGENASSKIKIGVQEINTKLKELSGLTLPVRDEKDLTSLGSDRLIVIGNAVKEGWIKNYCSVHKVSVTPQNPGEQGYMIRFAEDKGKEVAILCGSDDQGALYACVTFCHLLSNDGGQIWAIKADIWDKPDFKYRMMDDVNFHYYFRRDNWKEIVDFALKHKINMLWNGFQNYEKEQVSGHKRWFRQINDYAWERGIRILYGGWWNIGWAPVPSNASRFYYPYKGMIGHRGMLFCWSNDQLLSKKCDALKEFIQEVHPKAFYFHPIDAGGIGDPELWSKRCGRCQQQLGDDRAAADAHVVNSLYQAIKAEDKDILFITVLKPASATHLKRRSLKSWLKRVSGLIPESVFICVREGGRDDIRRSKDSIRQPIFVYHESEPKQWMIRRPFISSFRFAQTFYFGGKDIYWYNVGTWEPSKIKVLGGAEYSWNTNSRGSQYINGLDNAPMWQQVSNHPHALVTEFVPRACRVLFGNAAPEMEKVVLSNLSPYLMAYPQSWLTEKYCEDQLQKAKNALELLRIAAGEITKEYDYIYGTHLANTIACRYLAEARISMFKMKEYRAKGMLAMVRKELQNVANILLKGEAEFDQLRKATYRPWNGGINFEQLKSRIMEELCPIPPTNLSITPVRANYD